MHSGAFLERETFPLGNANDPERSIGVFCSLFQRAPAALKELLRSGRERLRVVFRNGGECDAGRRRLGTCVLTEPGVERRNLDRRFEEQCGRGR